MKTPKEKILENETSKNVGEQNVLAKKERKIEVENEDTDVP